MPMPRDNHEALLNELLTADLEHTRRTEILQLLRTDYGTVLTDFEGLTTTSAKLQKEKDDLVVSNSMLFRQIGIKDDPNKQKQEDEKSFSETVTLESLENTH
jgi:hypothetical protein